MHESETKAIPAHAEVESRCHRCAAPLIFPPGWFQEAFTQMRKDGWIE